MTGKKPWDKNPVTEIRTSQRPHKVMVCLTGRKRVGVLFRSQISESHGSTASAFAASKDCSTFSFSTCFMVIQCFSNPDLETTSMDFYMSF